MDKQKRQAGCYAALRRESLLRSVLAGAAVGFTLGFLAAAAIWFTGTPGLWLPIVLALSGTAICSPIFYFRRFRPTEKETARRIDGCGLEERAITMVEFEGDRSYLAQRQREDAAEKISGMDASRLRITVPAAVSVLAGVAVTLGIGMTVVTGLARAGILPGGRDFIDAITPEPEPVYVEVTYMVSEGGSIEGDEAQVILQGGETSEVVAVPDEGYVFDGWDDGGKRPVRKDANVQESVTYTAVFLPLDDSGTGIEDGEDENGVPGDQPGDKPGEGEGEQGQIPSQQPGGAGGQYLECNQVIDGETYYGSIYDEYYDAMMAGLSENTEMDTDIKNYIDNYFKIIQASDPDEENSE